MVDETEMPVCMHVGSGTVKDALSENAPMAAWTTLLGSTLSHPITRADAAKALADVTDDEVKRIVEDNARQVLRFFA